MAVNFTNAAGLLMYLPGLSKIQKIRIKNGAKIEVCREKREGWSGELPFFIFWCGDCDSYSYDYPHGHIHRRYLTCHNCSGRIDFRPWWIGIAEFWNLVRFAMPGNGGRK